MNDHARMRKGCLLIKAALLGATLLGAAANITLTTLIPNKETH